MNYAQRVEWLKQYQQSWSKSDELWDELMKLKSQAGKCTSVITGMPHGSDGGDRMCINVERIIEIEMKYIDEISNGIELRIIIERAIMGVQNDRQREILRRRYIMGEKWEKIAWEMHLDYRWIWRQHQEAVEKLTIKSDI